MGFGQGLSGLNAAAQQLDVIGNNIANSGTVGFKASTASFADFYANSKVGMGVQVASINQRFTGGIISSTGNQFDMAIDGDKGLFRVQDPSGNILYTRNGQFFADKDNYIINAQGQRLTGYGETGTDLGPIMVPVGNIAPQATTGVTTKTNLDANAPVIDPAAHPFDPTEADSFTHSLPISVYDSLGNAHQLTQYFVKRESTTPGESSWEVYYRLNGNEITSHPDSAPANLVFSSSGLLLSAPPTETLTIDNPGGTNSPADDLTIALGYAGSTQFGGPFSPNFTQTGYPTGEYAGMSIAKDGQIIANYTNGETQPMGYIALAAFNNLQGLQPVGGNAWIETGASGGPVVGRPGTNGLATLQGQSVEESNVDMSQELVNMIIAQRTYQANAQTIKTQDQVMQTLISMR